MKDDPEALLGLARLTALALTAATLLLGVLALAVPWPQAKLALTAALVASEVLALALWTWADRDPGPY